MNPYEWVMPVGEGIYVDGNGWQPWQDAFNPAPIFGGVSVTFGIVNLIRGNDVAGWVQIGMGIAAIAFGFLVK